MPVVRYQIRNEYGLADPELYRAADQDDPEALLEGVAMAGLVGVLRQLGDLAEFAAEIFHELHEEVMATAARGHGLKLRVQQLEADFPSVEKAFLSQTSHSHFGYNAGIHWHANHRTDKNLITRGDMPRFILDSYEECRGPPRLFMLDKFDVAGAGACLKRYSDPSFFKTELASSGIMEAELQREKKGRKIRKKLPRWKNGKVVDTSLALYVKSEFEPDNSEPVPEKPPTRRVKLKSRHLDAVDTNNRPSYMKGFLEVLSAEEKVVQEYPKTHSIRSTDSGDSAPDIHEILIDNSYNFPSHRERNHTQPLLPTNELENQNIKSEEFFEALPEPCNKVENMHSIFKIVEEDGISIKSEDKTDVSGDSNRSSEAKKDAPVLQAMYQKKILSEDECTADEYRSDDIGSDVDNFMDALNTIESETETDFESRAKLYPGFSNKDSPWIHSDTDERRHELPWRSSESKPVEKSKTAMSMRNSIIPGIPSLHDADNITMTQSYLRELESAEESKTAMSMRNNIITGKPSLHDADNITMAQSSLRDIMALEDLQRNSEVIEFESPVCVLSDGLCSVEAHEGPGFRPAIREATSCSSAMDSTSSLIRTYPQGSSTEVKSTSSDSSEISSYVRNDHIVGKHLDDNPPCMTESSTASKLDDIVGLSLAIGDGSGKIYPAEPEGLTDMIDTPCDVSHKQDDTIPRCFAEHIEDLLRPEQDSWNQDTEASETGNSSNSSAIYPVDSSLVLQPDDLAAEKECLGQAGDLDSEIFPELVRATQEVSEQLDGQSSGDYVPEISQPTEDEEVMTEKLDVLEHLPKAQNIVALENVHVGYVEDETLSPTMSLGEVTPEKLDALEHFPEGQNLVVLENVSDGYVEDSTLSPAMSIGEPEVMAEKLEVLEHFHEAQNLVALENVFDGYVEDSTLSPIMSIGEPEVVTEKFDVLEHLPEAQNLVAPENVVEDSTFFPTMSIGEPEVVTEKLDVLEHLPEAQDLVALENVPEGYVEDLTLPPTMSIGEPEEPEVMTEKLDELEHLPKAQNLVALENVHDGYVEDSTLPPTMSIREPEVMMEKLDELEQLPKAQNLVAVENVHDGYVEDSTLTPTMSIGEPEVMMEKLDELEQLPKAQNPVAVENVHDGYVEDSVFSLTMSIEEPEVMMEKLDALERLPEAQNLVSLQNVPDGYIEDLTLSPTMSIGEPEVSSEHDAESCSCGNLSQNAHANSPFIDYAGVPPAGVDEEVDDFIASGEVLASSGSTEDTENADYVIDAKISDPNILTLESELLSNEESLDDKGVELEDHVLSSPRKTTLPGNSQVQSIYEVIDVPHPISDDFGIPIGCTVSALHHVSEQIVDSSSNIVTAETVVDHDETSFVHSPEISGFDGKSQDLVSSDGYPNQQSLDTNEASSPTNAELLYSGSTLYSSLIPKDGNLLVSIPAATSSDLCTSKLSDSSDNELPNCVCHTMSSEHSKTPMDPTIGEDRKLCSVESERDFSPGPFRSCTQESEKDETPYFVHPVMPDEESSKEKPDDESEMSPSQEGELLVPSDLQSETIRVVEQEDTLNSVEFDGKPPESGLERESDTMSTDGNICELDIPTSSNTDTLWQLELEASVPSECSSVRPVNSSPPNATSENGELLFVADVDLTSTEFATEQFSEPSTSSDTFPGPQIQNTEEAPPLPPLPPLEWRMGKLRLGSSVFDGSFSQPLFGTNLFSAPLIKVEAETIQLANMSVTLPSKEESKPHHTLSNSENKRLRPLKLSELPPIMGDRPHVYSHNALQGGMLPPPSNPFAPFQFLEHEASQLYHTGERNQPLEDSRPQLGQVMPALDLEIYQHAEQNEDINGLQSMDPFSVEEDKYQYNVGGYRGGNLQYLPLSAPLPTKEPMMPHHGYVSSTEGHSHMLDDGMLHTMEDVKPNRKFPSIRDLPRHPLIDAVAAHDKTKLRKVSELIQPSTKPKAERDSLLEQIRNKSFNLKPASATKPNIKGPRTNLKVAAILEKANAIRQACAGSDEDDDGDSWSDS